MGKTLAIYTKEVKSFFLSPGFFLVCFLCSVIFSFVYPISLEVFSQAMGTQFPGMGAPPEQMNIHYAVFLRHLAYVNLMMIFLVPALTMKLFSEEKKMRTLDLLLTSPITSAQIVIGKYFAALTACLGIIFIAFLYPLVTSTFADVSWAPLFIAFFGIFLVGAVYAAMNIFCSSLTESAIVAYVMAVILNVSIWFVGMAVEVVDGPTARQVLEHISLNQHLNSLVTGTIRTSSIVFFLSIISLFGFLAERVVESARWR